jgi:hypothetical protein
MSQTPDLPDTDGPNLRRALATLPAHEPDEATWARIEAHLAADKAFTQAIPTLPLHTPDEELWAGIVAGLVAPATVAEPTTLPAVAPPVMRRLWPARAVRRALAVAASMLLLLGGWWQLHPRVAGPVVAQDALTFSEEEAAQPQPAPTTDLLEQQGRLFIEAHCSSRPVVCQSSEFRTLRTQLQELETQEARLRQDARRFGTSPELLREQARLITLKASVTRELVQLLIS